MKRFFLLSTFAVICSAAHAQTLEQYFLPPTVSISNPGNPMGSCTVSYTSGGGITGVVNLTANSRPTLYNPLAASVSLINNEYVVCTVAPGASPPTTLYIQVGTEFSQLSALLSTNSNAGGINTMVIAKTGGPPVTIVLPTLVSNYTGIDNYGAVTYSGTGGVTAPMESVPWKPTWTSIGGNQYKSSVCTMQTPSAVCDLQYTEPGTTQSCTARAAFNYAVNISLTP